MADLFIYGTLRDRDICEKVLGRHVDNADLSPAIVHNYAAFKVAKVSYPCLLPHQGGRAEGFYFENLTDADLAKLDLFEGVNYTRTPLRIMVDGKQVISAYYKPDSNLQTDGFWTLETWQKQGKAAFLGDDFNHQGIRLPTDA